MKSIVLAILIACPIIAFAEDEIITCDPPQGTRIDFFSYNKINLQNNSFLMGRDQVQGMKPRITLHADKTLSFAIGDATDTTPHTKAGNMQVLVYNTDQISFVGMINEAPVLGTYYPKNAILIYSQQSIWPGPDYQGARAVIFYAKCGPNVGKENETTVPSMGSTPVINQPAPSGEAMPTTPMQPAPTQAAPGTMMQPAPITAPQVAPATQPAPGVMTQPAPNATPAPMPTTPNTPTPAAPATPNAPLSY